MKDRRFRGDGYNQHRSGPGDFDPIVEGERHGLAPDVSAAIWDYVRRDAPTTRDGFNDESVVRERFDQVAKYVAARGGRLAPWPGKRTRVDVLASGRAPVGNVFAPPVPGKTTLVMAQLSRHAGLGRTPGRTTLVIEEASTPESRLGVTDIPATVAGTRAAEIQSALEQVRSLAVPTPAEPVAPRPAGTPLHVAASGMKVPQLADFRGRGVAEVIEAYGRSPRVVNRPSTRVAMAPCARVVVG